MNKIEQILAETFKGFKEEMEEKKKKEETKKEDFLDSKVFQENLLGIKLLLVQICLNVSTIVDKRGEKTDISKTELLSLYDKIAEKYLASLPYETMGERESRETIVAKDRRLLFDLIDFLNTKR